jgi:hypothetical protein
LENCFSVAATAAETVLVVIDDFTAAVTCVVVPTGSVNEAYAALPEIKMEIVIAKHAKYLLADLILTVSTPRAFKR